MKPTPLTERIGVRLQRARLMRGYSLRELAEALAGQASHTQLQKFESAQASPDSRLLGLLARILGVSPDYFFKLDAIKLTGVEYRKLTKLGVKPQKQLEEQALEFFERYLEIEKILQLKLKTLPEFSLEEHSSEELPDAIEEAAQKLRNKWGLGNQPIPNVHFMLESLGVKVKLLPDHKGFDGFSAFAQSEDGPVPVIGLNTKLLDDLPRLRFTALHELGHLVLRLPPYLTEKEKEVACHRFGSAFLIPRTDFVASFGNHRQQIAWPELKAIKSGWGISFAAIMQRALQLGLITPGRHKSFYFVLQKLGWRSQEPNLWKGDESSCRFKQLVYRALSEELITRSKACTLLGIAMNELNVEFDMV